MTEIASIDQILSTPLEELTYEQAFEQLEQVVSSLETGEHPLETTLSLYERGQSLASYCADLLDEAELKVKQLSGEEIIDLKTED